MANRRQGIFWIGTIPESSYSVPDSLPSFATYIAGQLEEGAGGFRHWQILVSLRSKGSLATVKGLFTSDSHWELTRSAAANTYVLKDATSVGQRFTWGALPILRKSRTDWDAIWLRAQLGDLLAIPASIRTISYRTLRTIAADYDNPLPMDRTAYVYWGPTGTGKTRRAYAEAGSMGSYFKDPRSKFWCGYRGESHIIIDEFRGGIDISHLLRWLDRYPVRVETKGSSRPLCATTIWITSNVQPELWYPDADYPTVAALLRRLIINPDGPVDFAIPSE